MSKCSERDTKLMHAGIVDPTNHVFKQSPICSVAAKKEKNNTCCQRWRRKQAKNTRSEKRHGTSGEEKNTANKDSAQIRTNNFGQLEDKQNEIVIQPKAKNEEAGQQQGRSLKTI